MTSVTRSCGLADCYKGGWSGGAAGRAAGAGDGVVGSAGPFAGCGEVGEKRENER